MFAKLQERESEREKVRESEREEERLRKEEEVERERLRNEEREKDQNDFDHILSVKMWEADDLQTKLLALQSHNAKISSARKVIV